jgi:hypothetical protein
MRSQRAVLGRTAASGALPAIATRVTTSDLEVARAQGGRLSFGEALTLAHRVSDEERRRGS